MSGFCVLIYQNQWNITSENQCAHSVLKCSAPLSFYAAF